MPRALITGAAGQDGRLLSRLLVARGWRVSAVVRTPDAPLEPGCDRVVCDVGNAAALEAALVRWSPDAIYHLAAVHRSSEASPTDVVGETFAMVAVNFKAAETILGWAVRTARSSRLVFVGSSQMYAAPVDGDSRIDESTPMAPRTFYAETKAWTRALCRHGRAALGLHASFAVLFNHESVFRTAGFVTRKIVDAAVRGEPLVLRDPDATADWCAAEDIVAALAAIGARSTPDEYVLGGGAKRSIRDWVAAAYARTGRAAPDFGAAPGVSRPALIAETGRALTHLGWRCETSFEAMVAKMVDDARARR
ncbi:MAG: GDP-mannose 4,6-dehydratase [Azospirillum sp.]|nr:GDP-mannose 4,6-dehydratase [Azospirillum sp.]